MTGKYMPCSYTCIMDPLVLEMALKVMKSVDNHTIRLRETLQPSRLCSSASRDD